MVAFGGNPSLKTCLCALGNIEENKLFAEPPHNLLTNYVKEGMC